MWVIYVFSADRRRPIGARHRGNLLTQVFGVAAVAGDHHQTSRPRNGRDDSWADPGGAGWPAGFAAAAGPPGARAMCSSSTDRARLASSGERIPPCGVPVSLSPQRRRSWPRMPAFRNAFTKARTRLSPTRSRTRSIRAGCVDLVEARRDVALDDPLIGAGRQIAGLGDRVVSPPVRAEAVATRKKVRLEDRLQHQLQGRLDHPVGDRRRSPDDAACRRPSGSSARAPATGGSCGRATRSAPRRETPRRPRSAST